MFTILARLKSLKKLFNVCVNFPLSTVLNGSKALSFAYIGIKMGFKQVFGFHLLGSN